jgi:acetyl-CoA C-acetyltransferase
MTHDGLTNPFTHLQMINEASGVANELGITRVEMDRFAARSHALAEAARLNGTLGEEIVPVTVKGRKGDTVVDADEAIRPEVSAESLGKLRAIGGDDANHTAGNAPGVNDGAGALVLASEDWAAANGKEALGTIVAYGQIGDEFACLAKTPGLAALAALKKIGKDPSDVDLWEINEAFASVSLNTIKMLNLDEDKVNVNGGAVALGHPIGASGARVIGVIVRELKRRGGGLGCAAICSGGGQGDAILIEV